MKESWEKTRGKKSAEVDSVKVNNATLNAKQENTRIRFSYLAEETVSTTKDLTPFEQFLIYSFATASVLRQHEELPSRFAGGIVM